MIELSSVSKTFGQRAGLFHALHDVSLTVDAGKICGVIGSSGAGKSTLIRCVNLLERPTSGDVIVAGQRLMTLDRRALADARSRIGMIFQHFNLLSSATVQDNVALPLRLRRKPPSLIAPRVSELLRLVGLSEKAHQYPAELSGGQKQRVSIARALAEEPAVLLCDEATSSLDPATTQSILALLKDINRRLGITILLVTHEMDVVRTICDEVAVIHEGRLVETGSVASVFARPRSEITRQLIASSLHAEVPQDYRDRLRSDAFAGSHPLLRLEFSQPTGEPSLLSVIAREYGIDVQVLSGNIESAGSITFGVIFAELRGTQDQTERVLVRLRELAVIFSILGYV